jgi:hypothetical protein
MNQEIIDMARQTGLGPLLDCDGVDNCVERFAALVRAAEREACAKLADEIDPVWESVADAIRARGKND